MAWHWSGLGLLEYDTKSAGNKIKMDKFDYIKLKSQPTINRVKSQPMEWENISAHDICDQELIFRNKKDHIIQLKSRQRT